MTPAHSAAAPEPSVETNLDAARTSACAAKSSREEKKSGYLRDHERSPIPAIAVPNQFSRFLVPDYFLSLRIEM